MSWNPLKKLSKSQSMVGSQQIPHNENFDNNVSALNQAELTTKKLYKETKKLSDCILAVNRYESKMTNDLSNSVFCQEEEELRSVVEEWHTFTCETNTNGEDFATNIHKTVLEPIKQLQNGFHEIKSSIKRYEQLKNDCLKYKAKVDKYCNKEKTSHNILKLKNVTELLDKAQQDFQIETQLLNKEIPLFIQRRIDYFQPSLAALIRSEAHYWGNNVTSFNDHNSMILSDHKTSDYSLRQSQRLATINALSIVADE